MSMRMPFGKYQGKMLDQIPISYLKWVLRECADISWGLRREIRELVEAAEQDAHSEPATSEGLLVAWDEVVPTWYREMALKFHPDRGGSTEAMKAINFAHERLKEMIGV